MESTLKLLFAVFSAAAILLFTNVSSAPIKEMKPVYTFGSNTTSLPIIVSMVCMVNQSIDQVELRWIHDGITYSSTENNSSGRLSILNTTSSNDTSFTTTLTILPAMYTDNGTYYCQVRDKGNSSSNWTSARTNLHLLVHLNTVHPTVNATTSSPAAELSCDMAGYVPPQSSLHWYRNGTRLTNTGRYSIVYRDGWRRAQKESKDGTSSSVLGVLVISSPTVQDSGQYQCRIEGYCHLTRSVQLTVKNDTANNGGSNSSGGDNNQLLTIIIAAVAGFLGLIVIILIIIIIAVACHRCRRTDVFVQPTGGATVTYLPAAVDNNEPEVKIEDPPPPVPMRTHSQSGSYTKSGRSAELPDLLQRSQTHQLPSSTVQYDVPTTGAPEGNPRVIPPERGGGGPPPVTARKPKRKTYYDSVNMLQSVAAASNGLPGASGISVQSVPSPHDVLSGSLQRQDAQNPPDLHPIYQDGFTEEDLAPYNVVDNDYDQIYSEPIEPATMLSISEREAHDEGLPYSAIYDDPKPLAAAESLLQVTSDNVIEIRKLGNGQFGQVILARTRHLSLVDMKLSETLTDRSQSILVAIKKLKTNAETGLLEAFDKEVKFMSRLNHDNVVRLLAVCTVGEHFIMMEYMENGDLNQFLQKHTLVPDTVTGLGDWEITPIILLYIGVQISSGMHYLGSRRFVHRDLATRNCLVGKDFIVKISDFGMSRRLYESAYYRVQGTLVLPIRWMACETFYGKFSVKSDTWAFGVTLWEVYTLAMCDPYDEMSDEEVIQDAIRGPNRKLLPKPEACPREVYDVMLRCWVHDPAMRADFGEIYSRLYMTYTSQAV
ncbi:PREDICTED: mitogen-activated protein kinase kinase kinase 5-like isoform X1 [Amphimedon queenslandica]|uniref:receptor protein-tyrosine kinase n=2 Tax=Amphimedon queenslandica TaxID=400682 RepID=A0AAN0J873_AMPQE|nr:PREDICTED: mitogen-activated protein kinase kinase kinase 5-like isoform X1 [Amphimedon queenslandica]|eukprot:XP_019852931.1 PREDICTED: mitogen-activated protein kinase kinase kinase 5-like isoform X1 [Amphimedon queenslandica]